MIRDWKMLITEMYSGINLKRANFAFLNKYVKLSSSQRDLPGTKMFAKLTRFTVITFTQENLSKTHTIQTGDFIKKKTFFRFQFR